MSSSEESLVEELRGDQIEEHVENEEDNVDNTEEVTADQEQENEDGSKTVVKPKRVIKNPQPKLNEETLKGPKGLTALQGYFEKIKFTGKALDQDLNVLMKTYEYWCHRMFPRYPFDDSIARLETLGAKRATQTYMKRIRQDLIFDEEKPSENEFEDVPTDGFVDPSEQVLGHSEPVFVSNSSINVQQNQFTDEQLEKIRQNKERAQKLREERMKRIREKASGNLELSSYLDGPSSSSSQVTGVSQKIFLNENNSNRLCGESEIDKSETNENATEADPESVKKGHVL